MSVSQMVAMWTAGHSIQEIAEAAGLSITVTQNLIEMKLREESEDE